MTYIVMPEGCRWYEVTGRSADAVFWSVAGWFPLCRRIAIRCKETGETRIFPEDEE